MSTHDELMGERRKKRDMLSAAAMNPYAATTNATHQNKQLLDSFTELVTAGTTCTIAGRVMALRLHGALAFADVFDGTARVQVMLTKENLGDEAFELFVATIDVGDFIEVTGIAFITKRETQALQAASWRVLTKSLAPMPAEHFGIKDEDMRFRKRYLDLLLDDEARALFVQKAKFWAVTRKFMVDHGFLEVETPTLEVTTGGAEARPFATHHNDFDMPVYMRICIGELWQKRLMAAGYPKTFEIGRAYRNEGTSPEHLQEFTNLEFYWAYADYRDGMTFVRDLYRTIAQEVFGTTKFAMRDHTFDLADEWVEIDYVGTIKDKTGIDILTATVAEMEAKLAELGVKYDGTNRERLTDTLWKYCRKSITGPAFLVNHPTLVAPLAKTRPGTDTVEMFQPIIAGSEVGRGYSELNDPDDQRARFEAQKKLLDAGDDEAMMADWEFVEMLEHGMPPTCGFGFGERLFGFLAGKPLREAQLFPLMKPENKIESQISERKVAVAVLNQSANLLPWQQMNTVAHLSAKLGVVSGKSLVKFDSVVSKDGMEIPLNIQHAILIKETPSSENLLQLLERAATAKVVVTAFTREMLASTNDTKIKQQTAEKEANEIEYLGVLVFGNETEITALTETFPLLNSSAGEVVEVVEVVDSLEPGCCEA